MCTSNRLPGHVHAAGLGSTIWKPLH
jgi:hypothetical protein